ncbi:MAG: hypothetical protein RL172_60 [Bacteroidota bacterium]
MKKIFFILMLPAVLFTACSKELDINPTQSVNEDFVFSTDANIKAALNGAYDVVSSADLEGGNLQLYAELLGANGEISWVGTFNEPDEIFNKSIITTNSFVRDTWSAAYRAINICNNIIANINVVNEGDRDRVKGEALFLRGLMYFELVKLYGKPYSAGNAATNLGVQIVTVPTVNGEITEVQNVARSTVAQTYEQVISDLSSSKNLMGEDIGVYAGKYTAAAILSRVYLQMGDYTKARDEANDVIENAGAGLEELYSKAFNNTSPSAEDIFVLPVTAQDGANDLHTYWSIADFGARDGDVEINQNHFDLYDAADARLALFYDYGGGYVYSGKWLQQYKYIPLVRLAEMYLTRAEANFRLGTATGAAALADVNMVHERAGLPALTALTLDDIILERHLELAHEGQRIHDIKRLKQTADGFAYDANELVFPIPQRDVDAVGPSILVQNPGY